MVIRAWLGMLVVMMVVNANVASAYLFSEFAKPIPFYFIALVALFWLIHVWDPMVVVTCCGLSSVALFLRGCEVLAYATEFNWNVRMTGATLWWFASGTTFSLGVLNVVALSKKEAEAWVWDIQQPPS